MGMIMYGTKVFTKLKGYFGEKEECPVCHKIYKKGYVQNTVWFHLNEVPLFPVKRSYFKMCPICGNGINLKSKEAKNEMIENDNQDEQKIEMYAKHILANKPKGILSIDNSYEFWVKDLITGEEICVASEITKDMVKDMKKGRGLKNFQIINV